MAGSNLEAMPDKYSKENRWYYKSIDNHVTPESRRLLQEYSQIPPEDIDSHLYKLRDILWSQAPYPCVGKFAFITAHLPSQKLYTHILAKLRQPAATNETSSSNPPAYLLDLGCCVGQELRSLVHRGISPTHLYGTDINPHFLRTSYELFNDQSSFTSELVAADIFSPHLWDGPFHGWENKFSVIYAGLFLHVFSWEQQIDICCTIVRLLSEREGSLFVGQMAGCVGGGERDEGGGAKLRENGEERKHFLHDGESFGRLWGEVAGKTGTVGEWVVEGDLRVRERKDRDSSGGSSFFTGEGVGWFTFSVERVKGSSLM